MHNNHTLLYSLVYIQRFIYCLQNSVPQQTKNNNFNSKQSQDKKQNKLKKALSLNLAV